MPSGEDGGGPAFPVNEHTDHPGMSLRDWFAGMVQADDRLVKCVRAMDDTDLAIFARCPTAEADFMALGEVEKYIKRFELEAKAIARVRFMQANAMLAESQRNPDENNNHNNQRKESE